MSKTGNSANFGWGIGAGSIEETVARQTPTTWHDWICPRCVHYLGGIKCKKNVFISVKGTNMAGCTYYESGDECRHCGLRT